MVILSTKPTWEDKLVEKMPSFTYGTRVIENERQVRLKRNVRRIGDLLHAVVNFCFTFFLFVFINVLLSSIVQNTQLTFIKLLNLVQQNAEVLLSNSLLSIVSFTYQHSVCLLLAVAFTCVYHIGLVIKTMCSGESDIDKEQEKHDKDEQQFHTEQVFSAVSYRYKVCFLS